MSDFSTNESLAYIAGYMDADGCFSFSRKGLSRPQPVIQVGSTNLSVLVAIQRFFESFGCRGNIHKDKRSKRAFHQLMFQAKPSIMVVCGLLLPYLKIKRDAAQDLLSYCRLRDAEGMHGRQYIDDETVFVEHNKVLNSGASDDKQVSI